MADGRNKSLAAHCRKQSTPIIAMLVVSLGLFLAGLFRPFTVVTKLWIFENEVSVYHGLIALMKEGEHFLFTILLVFTVVFPFVKILSLLVLWSKPGLSREQVKRLYAFVASLGKWSMLDVFVVAILVLLLRSSSVADIRIADGLLLFCASVILTQFASQWTGRIARRHVEASN
jgi:paraquat-inducible protein A